MSRRLLPAPKRRAQALVELALILPVLLIMLLGMIDLGRAFVFGVAVQNGAREAARVGANAGLDSSITDAVIAQRLIDASSPALDGCAPQTGSQPTSGCPSWSFTISPAAAARSSGTMLTVTASGQVSLLAGFLTGAMGLSLSPIRVQGQAVMEIL